MKITIIVGKVNGEDIPWILGAWDEYTIDGNEQGFSDAVEQFRRSLGNTEIRTAQIEVPEGFLQSIYRPIKVQGRSVGAEGVPGGGPMKGQSGVMKGQAGGGP
jgi:hypothetical protein